MGCRAGLCRGAAVLLALLGSLCALALFLHEPHRAAHLALPEHLRPFRPFPIRAANAVHRMVKAHTGFEPIPLDADAMIAAACAKHRAAAATGAPAAEPCDFGENSTAWGPFRDSFAVFVESLERDGRMTLIGRTFAQTRAEMFLTQRLALVARFSADAATDTTDNEGPGDAERCAAANRPSGAPVRRPLFVTGLPRTGTTFLHTLLAQDTDNFLAPLNWMVVNPTDAFMGHIDESTADATGVRKDRIDAANRNLDQFKQIAKGIDAQHVMNAFAPEEDIVWMGHTWTAFEFLTYFTVPGYAKWLRDLGTDRYADAFRWHRRVLEHLGSPLTAEERAREKAWVLKTPFHMGMLDAMAAVYPDARLVMTHRRPVRALTSLSSLQIKLRSVTTDDIDPHQFADEFLTFWGPFAARAVNTRRRWAKEAKEAGAEDGEPGSRRGLPVVDVNLHDLHKDPMSVVARIYQAFGLVLSPERRARMEWWLQNEGSRGKHGRNPYKAEWFGLEDRAAVLRARPGLKKYDDFFCELFADECL